MSKEELISYFSTLDVPTLERLKKYSELIFIPEEDMLVDVNMSAMVEKAHSIADIVFPSWTDRSKSDFGEFLVNLFAFFSEKDFWYINAFANEAIFQNMHQYSNAFCKAVSLGYSPNVTKGSEASFIVYFEGDSPCNYEVGDLVVTAGGLEFFNAEAFSLSDSESSKALTLKQGKVQYLDVSYNGYSVIINRENVDLDSISISVGGTKFSRVNNFAQSGPNDTHFLVLPEEDGGCSIFFGDNELGVNPTLGSSISITFSTCKGANSNISLQTASVKSSKYDKKATEVLMKSSASGGVTADSLKKMKEKAVSFVGVTKSSINIETAEANLLSFSFVKKAKVTCSGTTVAYQVIPTSGSKNLTDDEKRELTNKFEPTIMLGFSSVYMATQYVDFLSRIEGGASKLIVNAIVDRGYDLGSLKSMITQVISDTFNPLCDANYGDTFSQSNLEVKMRLRVKGVRAVTLIAKVGSSEVIIPEISLEDIEIFQKINDNLIEVRFNVV